MRSTTLLVFSVALLAAGCGDGAPHGGPDAGTALDGGGADVLAPLDGGGDAATAGDSSSTDAATAQPPVPCGSEFCRFDQTCVAGSCRFSCTGTRVPQDYATLGEAVNALHATGGTICVSAGTYPGTITLVYPIADLTIIGESAASVHISSEVDFNDADDLSRTTPMHVELKGLSLEHGLEVGTHSGFHDSLTLIGDRISGQVSSVAASLSITWNYTTDILVDGAEISCGSCTGVELYPGGGLPVSGHFLIIENSWLHNSDVHVGASDTFQGGALFVANTFHHASTAAFWGCSGFTQVEAANNLLIDCMDGLACSHKAGTFHHNGYISSSESTGHNKGDVLAQAGDVDTSHPPMPMAGSVLRGAADPTLGPDHDFWNNPRSTPTDMGAVQGF